MKHGRYRLQGFDYRANRWYFITTVTAHRAHLLGEIVGTELNESPLGEIVRQEIEALPTRRPNVEVAVASVLPNHVHLLLGLRNECDEPEGIESSFRSPRSESLGVVVGNWKAGIARRARREGAWGEEELFQRRFHDRVVRGTEEWNSIADYILWNPINWHLDPFSDSREPTEQEVSDWKRQMGM